MRLGSLIRPDLIFPDLPAADRAEVLRAFAERLAGHGLVGDAGALLDRLQEREQLGSTAIGGGIAIPHCKLAGLEKGMVAIGLSREGVSFGAADGLPVDLFFLVVSPSESPAEHLQILAALSRWIKAGGHADALRELRDAQKIYDYLQEG